MRIFFVCIALLVGLGACKPELLPTRVTTDSLRTSTGTTTSEIVRKPKDCRMMSVIDGKLFVASVEGLFWTSDLGNSWTKISGGGLPNTGTDYIRENKGILFVGLDRGGLWSSRDTGKTWEESLDPSYYTDIGYSESLMVFHGDTVLLSTRSKLGYEVMRSTASGAPNSWVSVLTKKSAIAFYGFIKISNTIFTFGSGGEVFSSSAQTGYTEWNSLESFPSSRSLSNYYPLLWGKDTIVMPTTKGVYVSTDKCASWKAENLGLKPDSFVSAITANADAVFIAPGIFTGNQNYAFDGIYRRKNNIGAWEYINTNIPRGISTGDNANYVLTMQATKTHLFIGTHGDGVKVVELSKVVP